MGWDRGVWLVRHGNRLDFVQPTWFDTAICRYDPPLCPAGLGQARELAGCFRAGLVDHLFVSPFLRALQTAAPVAIAQNLPLKIEAGLGEWLNPAWMSAAPVLSCAAPFSTGGVHANCPIDLDYRSPHQPQYPESESQMLQRAATTMDYLISQYDGNLLVVAHKESLRGCAIALTGTEPTFSFEVCAITVLRQQGDRWIYESINNIEHLSDPGVKVAPVHPTNPPGQGAHPQ